MPKYLTMAPAQVRQPFHRDGWVYEEKIDGWRMLAYKDGRTVRIDARRAFGGTLPKRSRSGLRREVILPDRALGPEEAVPQPVPERDLASTETSRAALDQRRHSQRALAEWTRGCRRCSRWRGRRARRYANRWPPLRRPRSRVRSRHMPSTGRTRLPSPPAR